ncbi:uncharacterized protein HMPREF1541_01622 [Cyphellophora europaea CBS 101466]|uniref:NmrA-like domain-containing protein n=1 Tax=Cyphellophora europaea (strain CBS 101466) TaxID=1220924 RepID=W2S184_CYPE1|nr:uncharacterized protein HMPREF1541_01622 [Cyphellophora europaea CBS 101466]ETN42466.1 hypothetical protein HMPREF1541_01622 [Cyphellophora europaea CBS 101466]
MLSSEDTVLIFGATGNQGSATIRGLLALSPSTTIHALVRDPDSPKSKNLQTLSPNIRLFPGDFDSPASLSAAAANTTAAFINVSMVFSDFTIEQKHMQNILTALAAVPTMKRVVYASGAGAKDPSVPGALKNVSPGTFRYAWFENKFNNEMALQREAEKHGWDWTVLQPAVFLTNWLPPLVGFVWPQLGEHRIATLFPRDFRHYWVDPDDTGKFAARALLREDNGGLRALWGQTLELANEYLTLGEVLARLEEVAKGKTGKDVSIVMDIKPLDEARKKKDNDVKVDSELFQIDNPPTADIERVRSFGIELQTVKGFFEREQERLREVLKL